jgi:hypothetical protein
MTWHRLRSPLIILLLASSCDGDSSTNPVAILSAQSITFTDDETTIKGGNVQVILEGLNDQQEVFAATDNTLAADLKAIEAQVSALRSRVDDLEAERDALKNSNTALAARILALEDAPPPFIDVLATDVLSDVLPSGSLLATLETLHTSISVIPSIQTDVAELNKATTELKNTSSSLTECPEGTAGTGDFCMELSARGEDGWTNANFFCAEAGGHLCTTGELSTACTSIGPLQPAVVAPELTTNIVVDPTTNIPGAIQLFDGELCDFTSDKISAVNFAPYRCCYDRLVLGAGPKPAEPPIP